VKRSESRESSHSSGGGVPRGAFTVIEVLTVVVIIAILAAIVLGVIGHLRGRAKRAQCMANLRALHVAAEVYLQQNGAWPQIRRRDFPDPADFANAWIDALASSGAERSTWICPSVQELLQSPDYYSTPEHARIDYIAMPFDDKPTTAHEWARQPWFVEVGNVHGSGNLMIFADGSIADLNSVAK
jgi:prepilin-type N-terminal cleavage/methylation domain-containing protein